VEILAPAAAELSLGVGDRIVTTGASSLSDESAVMVQDESPEAETETSENEGEEEQGVAA
jgi:hypothetical protein